MFIIRSDKSMITIINQMPKGHQRLLIAVFRQQHKQLGDVMIHLIAPNGKQRFGRRHIKGFGFLLDIYDAFFAELHSDGQRVPRLRHLIAERVTVVGRHVGNGQMSQFSTRSRFARRSDWTIGIGVFGRLGERHHFNQIQMLSGFWENCVTITFHFQIKHVANEPNSTTIGQIQYVNTHTHHTNRNSK